MSSDMNKENMDPGGGQDAFQPRQQKMQEDYGQSSATDFDQMHQRPQRAVVGDPMQQAPIHQEPPSKGDLMTQQTSGVDNETARKTAMHTNNPFVVRENQQAATVRSGMPSLPAAGVFDLDAAGNSSIITGYDNDPRSFNMRTAKQVAANHDKKSSISAHQQKQTYPTTTTTTTTSKQAVPPGRKSSSSAWTSSSVTGGAAVAAAAAATATGGGIMAKCVDYLRGSQQQASQDSMDEGDEIASPLKDESGGIGQYGPLESKDHPEFTEDVNDVWKNTGPGAAIARGDGGNVGGETAPDVGDYGPLNARDHPEFIENVGDPWKSTGPGAAIARGPEDNLVGDSGHKMQGHPFTEKVDDPWKQTSPTGAAQASDFSKSRMAAGGIAAGTLGTGVGAAGTSAFDDQSESSTRAMKSDDGNDMIHVYDEDAQPLMKEPREDVVAEPYQDPIVRQPDDTQAFGVGTHDQEKGIQSTSGQPRDTSWGSASKGKTYATAAGGGAAGAGIGAMAAEAARKRHQQDEEDDWTKQSSGPQKRRSTDQGATTSTGYDKAYSKGGPGIGAVPMPAGAGGAETQKQQARYFTPSEGTQPDTKPMRHDRRLSVEEQTHVACTAGGLGSNVDQSANGTTAAKQPPGSHIDSGKKMASRAAMGAGAGAATGAATTGATNIGQKDIETACKNAGLGSNVDQSPPATRAPQAGSTLRKTAATTGAAGAAGAGAGAGAYKYQRKSSTEQEEIAEACKAAGLGANVDQSASEPMKQPPGSTLPSQKQQQSKPSTAAKSAGIGAGAGAGVGAAIGAATASGGTDMTKGASEQAVADYQKEQSQQRPKGGFTQDLDDSTSAADPYSATRQYHSTREPLHLSRKDDDVGTGGTGDDIYDPYAKQGTTDTAAAAGGKKPSEAIETGRIPEREKDQTAYTLGDPARERQQSGNAGTAVAEGAALGGATGAAFGAGTSRMGQKQRDQPSTGDISMQDNHHPLATETQQQQGQRDVGKESMGVGDTQPASTTADDLYKQKQQQAGGTTTTTQDFGKRQQQQPEDSAPQPPRKSSDQAAEARQQQHARSVPQVLDGAVGGIDPERVGNMSSTKDAYATTGGGGAATAGGMGAAMGAGVGAVGAGMGSAGQADTAGAVGEGARRTSVQDYVTGMFDARRGSIKEKFGKFFHKQSMQQEGKDLQNVGNQKVQSFISQRRQSQGRAGL